MNNALMRLLEHKWAHIRHIETERHWIVAAYAVIIAGVLNQPVASTNITNDQAISYLLLAILGLIGALHSYRAAWVLSEVQSDINQIVQQWQVNSLSRDDWPMAYWSFSKLPEKRDPFLKWLLSQYRFWKPTFSGVYALIYTFASVLFLALSVWFLLQ